VLTADRGQSWKFGRLGQLLFDPGSQYRFSTTNYNLLAEVIQRATEESLRDWSWEHIFKPLGMLRTLIRDRHGEPVEKLQPRGILLDGSTQDGDPRLLLQIFSETMIGPVFFEFIQRKKDDGFGEGNFKALFESIERDQVARGIVGNEKEAS